MSPSCRVSWDEQRSRSVLPKWTAKCGQWPQGFSCRSTKDKKKKSTWGVNSPKIIKQYFFYLTLVASSHGSLGFVFSAFEICDFDIMSSPQYSRGEWNFVCGATEALKALKPQKIFPKKNADSIFCRLFRIIRTLPVQCFSNVNFQYSEDNKQKSIHLHSGMETEEGHIKNQHKQS